jgi:hypothetical protein
MPTYRRSSLHHFQRSGHFFTRTAHFLSRTLPFRATISADSAGESVGINADLPAVVVAPLSTKRSFLHPHSSFLVQKVALQGDNLS